MKILIVTDAWFPQINGVVRTLDTTISHIKQQGHEVTILHPDLFRTLPCPTYPEIRLALVRYRTIAHFIEDTAPDAIHIATEGPLGMKARRYAIKHKLPFTTAYHTRFPEYVHVRTKLPLSWLNAWIRRFHKPAAGVMVATKSLADELHTKGITNIRMWTRGVDTEQFAPMEVTHEHTSPVLLYVGRVAVEKNIEAFLELDVAGTKLVVGDGPQRAALEKRYPDAVFVGKKTGKELAEYYNMGDVFVFPSKTDTFGLVMLEALACGVPVAAYPVTGPIDVITNPKAGILDENLQAAVEKALTLSAKDCRNFALTYSWGSCAQLFLDNLEPYK